MMGAYNRDQSETRPLRSANVTWLDALSRAHCLQVEPRRRIYIRNVVQG